MDPSAERFREPDAPTADAVRAQLGRILDSGDFDLPERGRNFLKYVVEETLAGRSDRIKGYAIAVEVFGRSESFDGQNDPVVRIEAGRLRRALERYYLTAGISDPIVICVPKGTYVPQFLPADSAAAEPAPDAVEAGIAVEEPAERRSSSRPARWRMASAAIAAVAGILGVAYLASGFNQTPGIDSPKPLKPDTPSLVVRPFANLGDSPNSELLAAGLTEEVLFQIARFRELTVFGSETSRAIGPDATVDDIRRMLGVRYVLEGALRTSGDRMRVTARVLFGDTGAVVWSGAYESDSISSDVIGIEKDIAAKVATAIAQPYGTIFNPAILDEQAGLPGSPEAYECTLRYYDYRAVLSPEKHARTRDCLEGVVEQFPKFATAWAMLSNLYLDEARFRFNSRDAADLANDRALAASRKAVELEPENTRALQSLMTALFYSGDPAEALEIGYKAIGINPNDTELLGQYGTILAQSGQWARGSEFLEQARALNPGNSGYYTGVLAVSAYMLREPERAKALIQQADLDKFPIFHVVAALIYAENGDDREAAEARDRFLQARPDFFQNLSSELSMRNFTPEDKAFLIQRAHKAGFPVVAVDASAGVVQN